MTSESLLSKYLDSEVLNALAQQQMEARQLVEGNLAGAHRSPLSGFAVEFAGHREYVMGDDPRHIDWRVYYARDKYFVKQYELETNFVCNLLLDVSASMRFGEGVEQKLWYAQQLVALLAHGIIRQTDKVALTTFDDQVRDTLPPSHSFEQLFALLQVLDQQKAEEKTDFSRSLEAAIGLMGRRQIVMIFSDFLMSDLHALEDIIQRLRYQGHDVVLFQIAHHSELTFDLKGMIKFEGLESNDELLAQSEDLKRDYLEEVRVFNDGLHQLALRNLCEHLLVDTRRPIREALADYLSQRFR